MAQDPACGVSSTDSYARYDPDTSSWRTSQGSLFGEWIEYSETFAKSGMMRGGQLSPLPTSVPPTSERESGLWPTPVANEVKKWPTPVSGDATGSRSSKGKDRPDEGGLANEVKKWPTPKSSADHYGQPRENDRGDLQAAVNSPHQAEFPPPSATPYGSSGNGIKKNTKAGNRPSSPAMAQKNLWPTPCAHEDRAENYTLETSERHLKEGRQIHLAQAVRMPGQFPTPSSREKSPNNTLPDQIERQGGQLNPTWVEWLMGYPQHWTLVE